MSAQKMCIVPTLNGEVEVPVGTVILWGETIRFAGKGGYWIRRSDLGNGYPDRYGDRVATIVAVPDGEGGWTVPGATTPEPKWEAITPEQVAALPDRTPVRIEWGGVVTEGPLHRERTLSDGVTLHHSGSCWWVGNIPDVTVHAHPEDVPADPDVDLIERAARAAYGDRYYGWDRLAESSKGDYRQIARAVLAVARGEQA